MSRMKVPEYLRKQSLPISLSQHVIESLKKLDNKSEIVEEILTENMDRINQGDIQEAIKARDIQVRGLIAKALTEEKGALMEIESTMTALQGMIATLQEGRRVAGMSVDDAKGVAQLINNLQKKMDTKSFKDSLAETICKRIYRETEEYAKECWSI